MVIVTPPTDSTGGDSGARVVKLNTFVAQTTDALLVAQNAAARIFHAASVESNSAFNLGWPPTFACRAIVKNCNTVEFAFVFLWVCQVVGKCGCRCRRCQDEKK